MAVWSYMPQEAMVETWTTHVSVVPLSPLSTVVGTLVNSATKSVRLRYTINDSATCNSMEAFFVAQQGPFKAFQWFFEGNTYTVRFDASFTAEMFTPGLLRENDVPFVMVSS